MNKLLLTLCVVLYTSILFSQSLPNYYEPKRVKPTWTIGIVGDFSFNDTLYVSVLTNLGATLIYTGYHRIGVFGDFKTGYTTRFNLGVAVMALPILKFYAGFGGVALGGIYEPVQPFTQSIAFGCILGFPVGPGIQLGGCLGNPYSRSEIYPENFTLTLGLNFCF